MTTDRSRPIWIAHGRLDDDRILIVDAELLRTGDPRLSDQHGRRTDAELARAIESGTQVELPDGTRLRPWESMWLVA